MKVCDLLTGVSLLSVSSVGRFTGACYGLGIYGVPGIKWGWRNLKIHPLSLFVLESGSKLDLKGELYIGFYLKREVPMPGKRRTGLVVKSGGKFSAGNRVHLTMGSSVHVSQNAVVEIGDNTYLSYDAVVVARNRISIGANCAISWGVSILDSDLHKLDYGNPSQEVNIGDHVWVGHNVTILKGVTIGEGAVIGSCSLVNQNIPSKVIAAGIPAKIIKENIGWGI